MKREKQTTSLNKLIIKVKEGERIQKNIGRIFRKYNIIEYKEPGETLTINDFYKVLQIGLPSQPSARKLWATLLRHVHNQDA